MPGRSQRNCVKSLADSPNGSSARKSAFPARPRSRSSYPSSQSLLALNATWARKFADTRSQMPHLGFKAVARATPSKVFLTVKGPFPDATYESPEYYPYQKDVVTGDRPTLSPRLLADIKSSFQKASGFSQ